MSISSKTHALSINPATGEQLAARPWATPAEVESSLAAAQQGFRQWREQSVAQRAQALRNVGAVLRQHGEKMAQLISAEMGKPCLLYTSPSPRD